MNGGVVEAKTTATLFGTIDVTNDSTLLCSGAITGSAILEIVRNAGNFRTLTLRNVDFSGCTGKIAVGAAMKGVTTLALAGTSRDLHAVTIDIRPPSRQNIQKAAPVEAAITDCILATRVCFGGVAPCRSDECRQNVHVLNKRRL